MINGHVTIRINLPSPPAIQPDAWTEPETPLVLRIASGLYAAALLGSVGLLGWILWLRP